MQNCNGHKIHLSNNEIAVWHVIRLNPGITSNQIIEKLNVQKALIINILTRIIRKGALMPCASKYVRQFYVNPAYEFADATYKSTGEKLVKSGLTKTSTGLVHICGNQPVRKSEGAQRVHRSAFGNSSLEFEN